MADYNVEQLGINITSSAQRALASIVSLRTQIASTNQQFAKMNMEVSKLKVGATGANGIPKVDIEMKKITNSTRGATAGVNNLNRSFRGLGGALGGILSFRFLIRHLGEAGKQMINFGENYNLFVVSMGELKDEAVEFQEAMNKALGTNMSQTMRYQGFFQNLTNALGATNEQAFEMSKTLTMLTYDMASLFNWSPDVAFQRLQAGVVGQTKPLRYAGVDVTQQTIEPILGELGIEGSVKDLTQYQKVMLRMISILRQTGNAQNDFTRTIESPANQIRVLNDQIKELYRWIGGTFIGLISKALPYINGLVMALVELFKAISYLFGFTEEDFNFMNGGEDTGLPEIEEQAEGADGAVKKLLGSLRKFDEINNISMRGADGGGLGISSSDAKLWEELQKQMGYFDDTFAGVRTKAVEIKEKIMEWLGIFFELNKEDGEVVGFTGKMTTLGKIVGIFVGAFALGSVIIAIGQVVTALGTLKAMLLGTAGATGTVGAVGLLTTGLIGLTVALGGLAIYNQWKFFDTLITKIKEGNLNFSKMEEIIIRIAGLLGGINTNPLMNEPLVPHDESLRSWIDSDEYIERELRDRWARLDPDYQATPTSLPSQTIVVQVDKEILTKVVVDNTSTYQTKTGTTTYNW